MPRLRGTVLIAWAICIVVLASSIAGLVGVLGEPGSTAQPLNLGAIGVKTLIPLLFAIPGALIISRHSSNVIGWLLVGPALVFAASSWIGSYLDSFTVAPPPTLPNLLMVWFSSSTWLALIFPLILIPLVFPTGRPLTPRWRWPIYLAVGMILTFFLWSAGTKVFEYEGTVTSWSLTNPIGFLPSNADQYFMPVWSVLLAVVTAASLGSVVVRYRRASIVEREQMKWLLYACATFALVYIPLGFLGGTQISSSPVVNGLVNLLFLLSTMTIPAAVAIAILRYRLFDIDVIIRLTLIYVLVTGSLALVYVAGVVLLQSALHALTGQTSSVSVVITTLIIAVLFNPLRQRIQAIVDRRFFRQKYNAEQALDQFAKAARSGSDLDALAGMMIDIVQKTLQPTQATLQLKLGLRNKEP